MASREINVPFGPDKTNGAGMEPLPSANSSAGPGAIPAAERDPFAEPTPEAIAALEQDDPFPTPYVDVAAAPAPVVEPMEDATASSDADGADYRAGGLTDEQANAQGMDAMQMSILALKDSIGQGRELKAREKEREELDRALEADHVELADRESILADYPALAAEQDAIVDESTRLRDSQKAELAQLTAELSETEDALARMRAYHADQLQPLEGELGRVRASADQARNDERSRKSELNAAEKELSRADDNDANTMAIERHRQASASYDEARKRAEQVKEELAQVQRAYDDARGQADEAESPVVRRVEDLNARIEALKESVAELADAISAARKRRQYIDNVYQYPRETEKMRREVAAAEATARQMDEENDALRERLAQSKRAARMAKAAIAVVIVIIVVLIASFIIVSNR